MSQQDEALMTVSEAATRVGLHHRAIRRAIDRGELPAVKVCSRIRIAPTDFERWINEGRVTPSADVQRLTERPASTGLRALLDVPPRAT